MNPSAPTTAAVPDSRKHVPELDGIRGIAVLGVMAVHFVSMVEFPAAWAHAVAKATSYGVWGVDLFFVLSGFLITGILDDTRGRARFFQNFYARRSLRIFPLYYGVLLGFMVWAWLGLPPTELVGEVHSKQPWLWTYTLNFHLPSTGGFTLPYISHFWSLAVEEQFYLVWPWLIFLLPRRASMGLALGLSVMALALRILLPMWGYGPLYALLLTPCRLDTLCMGGFFALALRDRTWRAWLVDRLGRLTLVAGAVTLVLSVWKVMQSGEVATELALRDSAVAVFFATWIATVASGDGPAAVRAGLRAGWLRWIGKYSYGLYVYHGIIGWVFHYRLELLPKLVDALGSEALALFAYATLGTGLSVIVSVASYELFEVRFLTLKKFFTFGQRSQAHVPREGGSPSPDAMEGRSSR